MGDTAPAQAPGLLGGGAASGPRVHSAIVERLRARIAVCRQHHLNCEGRYERGRAESSERERESTLQLLHLAQHGQAARKGGKHAKAGGGGASAAVAPSGAAAPPPADYYPQQLLPNGTAGGRSGINGEPQQQQQGSAAEQRSPALVALQGSLKRKLVVNLSPAINKRSNGIADSTFLDIKRVRVGDNNLSGAQSGPCGNSCPNQSLLGSLTVGQSSQRKVNSPTSNAHANANGMFNMALKEVKKEPGETFSCSKHLDGQASQGNAFPNRYGEDAGEQLMDPELQELFNELTNISVPPMSDLELENMINATIKQDEPFNIDLGQQVPRVPPARSSSLQMDKMVIKQEYSPAMNQGSVGSPQMRPSSTGPAFTMSGAALSASSPIPSTPQTRTPPLQMSSVSNRPMPSWQEVSHAQQLKQIAANRQQHALIQQCQQSQPSTWPTLPSAEPSVGPFAQEKMPSASFHPQQFGSQSSGIPGVPANGNQTKGMNSYVYKTNSTPQGSSINIVMQRKAQDLSRGYVSNTQLPLEESQNNLKPLFHFNSEQAGQPLPSVLGSQSKPSILHYTQQATQQQPPSSAAVQPQTQQQQPPQTPQQQQQQPTQPLHSQPLQRPPNIPLALQQKIMLQKMLKSQPIPGMQYPLPPPHQLDQHSVMGQSAETSPGSGMCSNPNTGSSFMNSPQQALLNQQLKQQLLLQHQQQQQILTESEKITPQDQLNRHLTRPPPDYKDQRRNQVNIQQTHQYSGGSPAMNISAGMCFSSPVSTASIPQQASTLLSAAHGVRMPSHPAARHVGCYGTIPCSQPSVYTVTTSGASQPQRNTNQIIPSPNSPAASRQAPPVQGSNLPVFESGSGISSQPGKLGFNPGTSGQRHMNVLVTSNSAVQNWGSQETGGKPQDTRKAVGAPFPTGGPYPNQLLQHAVAQQQFPQRAAVPLNPLGTIQMRTPVNHSLNGQMAEAQKALGARSNQVRAQAVPHLNPPRASVTPPNPLLSNHFPASTNQTPTRAFQGTDPANDLAFDFLGQQGDSMGPALNSDSDFIDSLLKTEPGNDDWMKDINLDEILGGHS